MWVGWISQLGAWTLEHRWLSMMMLLMMMMMDVQRKCDQYWPSEGEQTYDCGLTVHLLSTNVTAHYTVRMFSVRSAVKTVKKVTFTCRYTLWINERANLPVIIVRNHCYCWGIHFQLDLIVGYMNWIKSILSCSQFVHFNECSKQVNFLILMPCMQRLPYYTYLHAFENVTSCSCLLYTSDAADE